MSADKQEKTAGTALPADGSSSPPATTSPAEEDIADLELADIIDAPAMQAMMEDFYKLTHIPSGVIDMKGRVLVAVGWQQICTRFFRIHPTTHQYCIESDTELTTGVAPGCFKLYRCKNHLWDLSTPIMVGSKQVGNFFLGQLFLDDEPVDLEYFRALARRHGFDEPAFMAALERVPSLSRETAATSMSFYSRLADMLSQLGYSNIKLARSERALRQSEEQLRVASMAGEIGIWHWQPKIQETLVSASWRRLFGVKEEEPITLETWRARLHPDDRARTVAQFEEAIAERREFTLEYRIVRPDGSIRWISDRGRASYDEPTQTLCAAGVNVDITERKLAEESLIRNEKLACLGRMAATISHEINNPLAVVINAIYLAKANLDAIETAREYLSLAEAELQRVSHIARQTLGFYRESSAPSQVSLTNILNSSVDLLRDKIKAKNAHIVKQYEGEIQLTGMAGELRQIVTNLLVNSLEAIAEHGTVTLRLALSTNFVSGQRRVKITMTDNGSGITAKALPHIFEPFFTTKEGKGSGLGLWVTRQLVEKQGGTIRVRSSSAGSHHGTTFSILLPDLATDIETKDSK